MTNLRDAIRRGISALTATAVIFSYLPLPAFAASNINASGKAYLTTQPSPANITEGQSVNFQASFVPPANTPGIEATAQKWSYCMNYGNGKTIGPNAVPLFGDFFTVPSRTYAIAGTYNPTISIYENITSCNNIAIPITAATRVSVSNNAPAVSISPSNITLNLGTSKTFKASLTKPGNSPVTYAWSGVCKGTSTSATVRFTKTGSHVCTVTVTDTDGDKASATARITVVNPTTEPTNPTNPTNPTQPTQPGNTDENGEVLSAQSQTCTTKTLISGFVYEDTNKNGQKDTDEKGVSNVEIKIYAKTDTDYELVQMVTTDSAGAWSLDVCPGSYRVAISTSGLPENLQTSGSTETTMDVTQDNNVDNINFALVAKTASSQNNQTSSFNWLWVIIPLAILLLIAAFIASRMRSENQR